MTPPTHNSQTTALLSLLAADGFVAMGEQRKSWVADGDGFVEHPLYGIQIHADPDMVRLIVPATENRLPEYRLALGRRGLTGIQPLRIMAIHARAALDQKKE